MRMDKILALALALVLAAGLSVSAKQHDHKDMADMSEEAPPDHVFARVFYLSLCW
jgi:hypothetical protein